MMVEDIVSFLSDNESTTREEWLAKRKRHIGASDGPKILGLTKYGDQLTVYMSKVLPQQDDKPTERQRWGHLLEQAIIMSYAEDHPASAVTYNTKNHMIVSKKTPFLSATLDAVEVRGGDVRPLEAKNVAIQDANLWQDGQCPEMYRAQLQHQMYVCEASSGVLTALIGGNSRVDVEIQRDDDFIDNVMLPAYHKFWKMVTDGIEPPVDHQLEASRKAFQALHPKEKPGTRVELSAKIGELDLRLLRVKEDIDELNIEKTMLESKIKEAIGDAEVGVLPWAVYKWKMQHRDAYMVEASDYRVLRRSKIK